MRVAANLAELNARYVPPNRASRGAPASSLPSADTRTLASALNHARAAHILDFVAASTSNSTVATPTAAFPALDTAYYATAM